MTPTRAVFLSYASQDAEPARKICDALRGAGIQVWFDQSELRGGDVWDQRIRREIHDCALFIPVISANTASRHEGYFRLEWDLADQRSHMMARDRAFIVPVCLDVTPGAGTDVPESFHRAQWTRLPNGQTPAAFVERIRHLLSPEPSTTMRAQFGAEGIIPAQVQATWSPQHGLLVAAAVVVFGAVAYFAIEKLWSSKPAVSSPTVAASAAPAAFNPPPHSIAVLPFADMSEKKDQEYFSDGLSEELIDMLAKIPDLRVPARTSSFYFKGKSETIATIARALGVANVLEGSVRKAGDQLRVTVQLIRADNGYHLWSETYDRELKDVFRVQDEIAQAVVSALKLKLAPGQQAEHAHGTTNTEAYVQYLLGRQLYFRANNVEDFSQAISAYRKAIAGDPNYAAAYAGLALAKAWRADRVGDTTKGIADARADAEKAVVLGPEQPEGYEARSYIRSSWGWDWAGAQADVEKALGLDAGNADARRRYVELLARLGRLPEAIAEGKRAIELDPLNADSWRGLANALNASGNRAAAMEAIHRALEIRTGDRITTYWFAVIQLTEGKAAEALETFRMGDHDGFLLTGIAMAECTLHHGSESQRALDEAIARFANEAAYQIAEAYAWCGEKDLAFQWLERAYKQRDGGLAGIQWDPLLVSLRGDVRYAVLLRKMNFPERTARSDQSPRRLRVVSDVERGLRVGHR